MAGATDSPLKNAIIQIEGGEEIPIGSNPTEYEPEKSMTLADQIPPGITSSLIRFADCEAGNSDAILFFDEALLPQPHLSVDFPRPDRTAREMIWQTTFPREETPRGELDYEFLSGFELTGGDIKNIALTAAFLAAGPRTNEESRIRRAERETLRKLISEEIEKNGDLSFEFLDPVEIEHVAWAMRREFQKTGKLIKREAFKEYHKILA